MTKFVCAHAHVIFWLKLIRGEYTTLTHWEPQKKWQQVKWWKKIV